MTKIKSCFQRVILILENSESTVADAVNKVTEGMSQKQKDKVMFMVENHLIKEFSRIFKC